MKRFFKGGNLKMRQEFPTIEELEDVGAKFLYYTDTSVIGEIEDESFERKVSLTKAIETKYCIYTETNTGILYIAKKGKPTFSSLDAQFFLLEEAKKKVYYMNQNGKRIWKYGKI